MKEKVLLAYSGGLDTSYCVKYLSKELNLEVYTATANTGGFSQEELYRIEQTAYELGVKHHQNLDITSEYYEKCIRYMVFGNVLRNNVYPLSVSSERVFQAIAIARHAKELGVQNIAHGSTGAGNDQIRFDLVFKLLLPDIKILTPIRDHQLSRSQEIAYLIAEGVQRDWANMEYSINKGLWGTSVGGKETLTSHLDLPEEAFPTQLSKSSEETLELIFEQGELVKVNGQSFTQKHEAILAIEKLAAPFAIGRDIHVGDTIIGIKGRVGFEAAASLIIIKAHQLLEKHTLTKWQMHWKEQLANWYGMMLHEAMYFEPVMRDIEHFLESTQKNVSGKVIIRLMPYRFTTVGVDSPHDLMNSGMGHYGEMNKSWTGEDVKGFTTILSNSLRAYTVVNHKIIDWI